MKRRFLREKEAQQLITEFSQKLKIDIKQLLDIKKPHVEVSETPTAQIFFIDGKPLIANVKDVMLPTLQFEKALQLLPKIIVNMGAIPYVCNGADIMAPGIVKTEGTFNPNDYVLVIDERHRKPLAIATTLTDSQMALSLHRGKTAKNIHYVGDSLWNQLKAQEKTNNLS
jgi:PUA domain protein